MLSERQKELYDSFYESTHENEFLDSKTEVLVGLSAAMAMDCNPCVHYYLSRSKEVGVSKGEILEILAKVMAVAAGQKRLQTQDTLRKYQIDLETYE